MRRDRRTGDVAELDASIARAVVAAGKGRLDIVVASAGFFEAGTLGDPLPHDRHAWAKAPFRYPLENKGSSISTPAQWLTHDAE